MSTTKHRIQGIEKGPAESKTHKGSSWKGIAGSDSGIDHEQKSEGSVGTLQDNIAHCNTQPVNDSANQRRKNDSTCGQKPGKVRVQSVSILP